MTDAPDRDAATTTAKFIVAGHEGAITIEGAMNLARAYLDATEWQPIETAPKDRELRLYGIRRGSYGYTPDEKIETRGRYFLDLRTFAETVATPQYYAGFTATHWLPLTLAPKVSK